MVQRITSKARALLARMKVLWYLNKYLSDKEALMWAHLAKGHVYTVLHRGKYEVELRHGLLISPGDRLLRRDAIPPEELAALPWHDHAIASMLKHDPLMAQRVKDYLEGLRDQGRKSQSPASA